MRLTAIALLTLLAAMGALAAPTAESLLRDLRGPDATRVAAMQLLPRHELEVMPELLTMLADEDPGLARAAYLVLWDIVNRVAAPGREASASASAALLLAEIERGPTDAVQRNLLRLVAIGVPEGHAVAPLDAMLRDAAWREPARTTLERINTAQARAVLRDALAAADDDFAVALLNSLAAIQDPLALARAAELLASPSAEVRAAAARAVAWTGDPAYVEALRAAIEGATDETRFSHTDSLLVLADALAQNGGNWDRAIGLYAEVLESTEYGVLRDAALMGLAKYGDERVVPTILAAAADADIRTRLAAIASLELVRGPAASKAICSAFADQPAEVQLRMIPVLGRRGGPEVVPALIAAAEGDNADLRVAGLAALGAARRLEGLPTLVAAIRGAEGQEQATAVTAAQALADALRDSGDTDSAGRAYAELYRAASTPEQRERALNGIMACPVPEAFEAVLEGGGGVDMTALPTPVLVSLVGALVRVGRMEEAGQLLETILSSPLVGEPANRLLTTFGAQPELRVAERLGVVAKWRLIGPFPFGGPGTGLDDEHIGEPSVDVAATYEVGDATLAWREVDATGSLGLVDLTQPFGMVEKKCAYATTVIEVGEDMDVALRMGSDDGLKVWVNGEVVHNHDIDRPNAFDEDTAPARLRAGRNELLVKISQGGGGWNFRLRITTPEGVGVPVTVVE